MGRLKTLAPRLLLASTALLGACSSDSTDTSVPITTATTQAPASTSTDVTIQRDTEIAIRTCVDNMSTIGLSMLLGDTDEAEAATETCRTALTMLDVDKQGVVGQTQPNRLGVLIAERNLAVSQVITTVALGGDVSEKAANLDGTYFQWQADVEQLLDNP